MSWGSAAWAAALLAIAGLAAVLGLRKVDYLPPHPPLEKRLPSALVIGAKKAGTRALLEFLRLHPDIVAPGPEVHFFDRYYDRGLDWYRSQMPPVNPGQMVVEKTPAYFVKREVPARIAHMDPHMKLILVLRDPVTRAISDYTQSFSKGRTTRPFQDMAFLDPPRNTMVNGKWNGIRIGLYERHLAKWLPYFPLSQIHLVSGEELVASPAHTMAAVERFLGLPPFIQQRDFAVNATKGFPCLRRRPSDSDFRCLGASKGRPHPSLPPGATEALRRFFRPHNLRLYNLTGRDWGWE